MAQVDLRSKGRLVAADRGFSGLTLGAGILVLAILALILVTTLKEAWPALRLAGLDFVFSRAWVPLELNGQPPQYGALAFIFGTVATSLIALVFAVPVSIGIALFLTELAPVRIRALVISVIDLLAAVPSVVFGLWGIVVVGPFLVGIYGWLHDRFRGVPVLRAVFGEPHGRSFMTAGVIVAIMIIPIITAISRDVLNNVPRAQVEGTTALGATWWESSKEMLKFSRSGLFGAVMLGLARAAGETMAITMVIGNNPRISASLFAPQYTMAAVIANEFTEAADELYLSALVEIGLVLFIITLIVNSLSRLLIWSMTRTASVPVAADENAAPAAA